MTNFLGFLETKTCLFLQKLYDGPNKRFDRYGCESQISGKKVELVLLWFDLFEKKSLSVMVSPLL